MSRKPNFYILIRIAVVSLILVVSDCADVAAQFTIRRQTEDLTTRFRVLGDSIEAVRKYNYFDPSVERVRLRALRRERNTVEFNGSLETSLQQFENWTGSGSNNFYALASIFFRHQYKKDKLSFDYRIDAVYGLNFIDEAVFKNKDEFKINTQLGWSMSKNWAYTASLNVRSQFTTGYKSRTERVVVSRFMAPGYFDLSVGFTYAKAGLPLKITLAPLSGNIVTVFDRQLSEEGKYGVKSGDEILGKIGPSVDIFFDKTFGRRRGFRYRSNLYAFTPYTQPNNPTVRWENTFEIKVSRFISTKLYGQLYYRKEDSTGLQYQYSFMVGLKYVFRNK